ncbi:hypothetical protein [Clavibacter michiganensis]|uniref:hypothetical protein n=1 Tax=Clavibacter michiganensis TaxID=28447 RepID=UPI00142E1F8A|nr:hypothetical protein [Clavibacter michiganensis]NIY62048.1 hypothetical protein [Clavibacter michiganensis subsp. michiganensis]QIT13108.1 hypothetical protein GRD74_16115 [Clavibacter michiganensis subsp. michiganensis]
MSTRARIISLLASTAVTVALLAGCSSATGGGATDDHAAAAKDEVAQLALKEFPAITLDTMNDPRVVGVWPFQDGYVALVEQTGSSRGEAIAKRWAYEYQPSGDGWTRGNYNEVDKDAGVSTTPHRAACYTVADSQEEQDSCKTLTD